MAAILAPAGWSDVAKMHHNAPNSIIKIKKIPELQIYKPGPTSIWRSTMTRHFSQMVHENGDQKYDLVYIVVTCEIKHCKKCDKCLVFYFTRNHV